MTPAEAGAHGIPKDLIAHLGDWRQYPPNIARHFPEGVSWFRAEQPWFFGSVMENNRLVNQLKDADVLILSGSGLSAHKYEHGAPEHRPNLERTQEVIRDHLGQGKWILGICFGGQLAVHAVGGTIGRLPNNVTEAGWLEHTLTPAGHKDKVFGSLPKTFYAPHFHNDYVETLPRIGTTINTSSGEMTVVRADILAFRYGYLDKKGLQNADHHYAMASVIEFDNGARIYQIQPHPEMATQEKANFLVRMNPWLEKEEEMGQTYYQTALKTPNHADFAVANIIPSFVREAQTKLEEQGIIFLKATMVQNLFQYLLP